MFQVIRIGYKLFDKFPHRKSLARNCIFFSLYCASASNENWIQGLNYMDNVKSWTSRVSNSVKENKPEQAVNAFKLMLMNDVRPNYVTILSLIKAVGELSGEDIFLLYGVHCFVIKMGFELEAVVVTALIGVYSAYDMKIVRTLFNTFEFKDVVLWSIMVSVYTKSGKYEEAFEYFRKMQYSGVEPNHISIISVLPACANLRRISYGKQIHGFVIKRLFCQPTNIDNSLVDMYSKCSNIVAALQIFHGIVEKDLISWKTIIRGCIENVRPSEAYGMFTMMRSSRVEPNEAIVRDIVGGLLLEEDINFGLRLHGYMLKSGFLAYVYVGTALMQLYAKFGEVASAEMSFDQLHQKDLIAWSAMIKAYVQCGHPNGALDAFKRMQLTTERPNEITFVSLLQACTSIGDVALGESIQAHSTKAGYICNTCIRSALIDFYCKFGRINQGRAIFDEVPNKDLICWSSMINGYGVNGCGSEALKTFSNMLNYGFSPNDVVFLSVLSACSHCGLEEEAWSWFHSMEDNYGISPKLAHYACMVDLLSRDGNTEDAYEFVTRMPMEPDKRIWGTILAGCKLSSESVDIAKVVCEKLVNFDSENTSYYVILSNLCAEQGRWEEVERLRNLVDDKRLTKATGYSRIGENDNFWCC